jgi:hypothetical protein
MVIEFFLEKESNSYKGKCMISINPLYIAYSDTYGIFAISLFSGSYYVPILTKFYNMYCAMNYVDEQGFVL